MQIDTPIYFHENFVLLVVLMDKSSLLDGPKIIKYRFFSWDVMGKAQKMESFALEQS